MEEHSSLLNGGMEGSNRLSNAPVLFLGQRIPLLPPHFRQSSSAHRAHLKGASCDTFLLSMLMLLLSLVGTWLFMILGPISNCLSPMLIPLCRARRETEPSADNRGHPPAGLLQWTGGQVTFEKGNSSDESNRFVANCLMN